MAESMLVYVGSVLACVTSLVAPCVEEAHGLVVFTYKSPETVPVWFTVRGVPAEAAPESTRAKTTVKISSDAVLTAL